MDDITSTTRHQSTIYYQPTPLPPPWTSHAVNHTNHVQPQFFTYAPPLYPHSSNDQLRTNFVAGLPEDVKPREIYNLFREFPGYQSPNLRSLTSSNSQFEYDEPSLVYEPPTVILYVQQLHIVGWFFDLEKGSTLYIDLAKSNSRSKRYRSDDEGQSSEKGLKGSSTFERSYDPGVDSIHMPGIGNSAYNTIGYPSTQSFGSVDCGLVNAAAKSNNTPCPTIFVANLGPPCSEEELTHVFSRCRGFLKLKMRSTYGAPVAFVDFQDTACSTESLKRCKAKFFIPQHLVKGCSWNLQSREWESAVKNQSEVEQYKRRASIVYEAVYLK